MTNEDFQALILVVRDGIFSAVFLWLLIREQIAHAETRQEYRQDLRDIAMRESLLVNKISASADKLTD